MTLKTSVSLVIYLVLYAVMLGFSLSSLIILKPFLYTENNESYIICNDTSRFEIGPNFIFAFENKLDPVNDAKARKLCQYKIISDYSNVYETPKNTNYKFYPVLKQESSWANAIFIFFIMVNIAAICIEFIANRLLTVSDDFRFGKVFTNLIKDLCG